MTDSNADRDTPASPDPAPSKAHGDALLDESGSRQGTPPPESSATGDEDPGEEG